MSVVVCVHINSETFPGEKRYLLFGNSNVDQVLEKETPKKEDKIEYW